MLSSPAATTPCGVPVVDVDVTVRARGPLFDGRAEQALEDFQEAAAEAVAEAGVLEVQQQLDRVLRNPTGHYRSRIAVEDRAAEDREVVGDQGVVYGPWLAGVTSRNQTTGFPGYDHWREATRELQDRAADIAQRELRPFLARMNG